jgi:autotransporter-associated beta strand protein
MGTVRVDSETRLGRNPAAFYAEQLTLNGGTLQATTSFAIDDINRGISLMNAGGTFQVNPGLTLTLPRSVAGVGSLRKTGQGTLQLSGINTYTGGTTNADGTLVLNGEIQGMPLMVSSGTLTGLGRCLAPAYIGTWGTFSPGLSIGTMTFSNTLHLAGTTIMELSASGGGCDLVRGMTTVTCGGTLRVLNTSGEFSAGQSFKLFDAEAYEGAFQTLELPVLTGTLIWDSTTLAKDGTLRVIEPKAAFASPEFINGALVLSGNGGTAGTEFVLRSSTNAALPTPQWPIVSTNTFDVSGAFRLTNEVEAVAAQKFYLIQTSGW